MLICFQISLLLTVVQLEPWLAGGQSDTAIISIKWPSPSCSQHPDIRPSLGLAPLHPVNNY